MVFDCRNGSNPLHIIDRMVFEQRTRRVFLGQTVAGAAGLAAQTPASTSVLPTTTGFVKRPGAEIYYETTGSGPAIVFAHGLGGNHLSLVAAGPILRQAIHLCHLRASRLCTVAAGRWWPRSRAVCRRPRRADRPLKAFRRPARRAIDGWMDVSRLRHAPSRPSPRVGNGVHQWRFGFENPGSARPRARGELGFGEPRRPGEPPPPQYPSRGGRAHGARAARNALPLSGNRLAQ